MTAILAPLLTAPRWLLLTIGIATALTTHTAAYRAGAAREFRAGFAAGMAHATARASAATGERTTRQLRDRLNAETSAPAANPDSLRCNPSARDCAD